MKPGARVTHVVVFGVDDEGNQFDELMPLDEFAKLFTWGQTLRHDEKGEISGMAQDIWVKRPMIPMVPVPTGGDKP